MTTATTGTTSAAPRKDPLGTFGDFLPWILYWVLVGNVPFRTSLLIALGAAALVLAIHRATDGKWRTLPVGSFVVFAVLAVLAFVVSDAFLERWLQPLSNLGLLLVVVGGMAVGRPFTLEYAEDSVSPAMARSEGFRWLNQRLTAIWVVAFVVMTVSSFVPPIVEGDATMHDGGRLLSILGYWIVPFVGMGIAALATVVIVRGMQDDTPADDDHHPGTGLPAAADSSEADGVRLVVDDATPVDEPVPVRLEGLSPGDEVELSVTLVDAMNRRFTSAATLASLGDTVDTGTDVPATGSWTGADPAGAVWSAVWAEDGTPDLFLPSWGPGPVLVEAAVGSRRLTRTVQRSGLGVGVRLQEIDEPADGLVARAFLPGASADASGPAGTVAVIVGGSEGGLDSMSPMAAALASRGIPSIVVALFGAPGLPDALVEVPLEPIRAGADWLTAHAGGGSADLAIVGLSRGAEAVLSAAAGIDALQPSVVVGLSPGSVVWEALDADGMGTGRSSWTVAGQPLPFAPIDDVAITRDLLHQAPRRAVHRDLPQLMHLRAAYEGGLRGAAATDAAVPSERIAGRLVLHAGGADALWPSDVMAAALVERRRAAGIDGDTVVVHPGAGHLLRWPLVPTSPDRLGGLLFGGDPADQAAAHAAMAASVLSVLGGRPLGAPTGPAAATGR
jgi:hypothetical protein